MLLCKGFEQLCSLATSATTGIRLSRATLHLVQASSSSTEEDAIFFGRPVQLKSSHSTSINPFQIWCSATTLSFYSTIAYFQLTFSQHYSLQSALLTSVFQCSLTSLLLLCLIGVVNPTLLLQATKGTSSSTTC